MGRGDRAAIDLTNSLYIGPLCQIDVVTSGVCRFLKQADLTNSLDNVKTVNRSIAHRFTACQIQLAGAVVFSGSADIIKAAERRRPK